MGVVNTDTTISDCTLMDNASAGNAGALAVESSVMDITNGTLQDNHADGDGGAVAVNASALSIVDAMIRDNCSKQNGGAVTADALMLQLNRCTLDGNDAGGKGGGIHVQDGTAELTDCRMINNTSGAEGGGVSIAFPFGQLSCERCEIRANTAGGRGGGVADLSTERCSIRNCSVLGNTAQSSGGGILKRTGELEIVGTVVSGNHAGIRGGGLHTDADADVINCSISRNTAIGPGGGITLELTGDTVQIVNSIIFDNADQSGGTRFEQQVASAGITPPTINYCCIKGWSAGVVPGRNNLNAFPRFMDADGADDVPGTTDDDLRLAPGSPCIDAADNAPVPVTLTTDLEGSDRFIDDPNTVDTGSGIAPIIDMGAYEFPGLSPCPADCAPPNGGNGLVNIDDLVAVVNAISTQDLGCDVAPDNGDGTFGNGVINFDDLIAVVNAFGDCP